MRGGNRLAELERMMESIWVLWQLQEAITVRISMPERKQNDFAEC